MSKPFGYWTKEKCIEDAKNFNTRIEWKKLSPSSYSSACKKKWLNDCTSHMIRLGSHVKRLIYAFEFSDKSVYVGLTYNSIERKNEHLNPKRVQKSAVYKYLKKTGIIPEFKELTDYIDKYLSIIKEKEYLEHYKFEGWNILNKYPTGALGGNTLYWTKENCIENAKKYSTLKEWRLNNNSVYCTAIKRGWIEECTNHMIRTYKIWTKEKCIEDAKKYLTVMEWRKHSEGAFKASSKNNWLDLCCSHMKRFKV